MEEKICSDFRHCPKSLRTPVFGFAFGMSDKNMSISNLNCISSDRETYKCHEDMNL